MQAALAAEAAFFISSKRASRIEFVVGVGPDNAGAEFVYDLENLTAFVGPDAGAQTVRRVVGALDRFLRCAESHHTQHRADDFFLCDPVRHRYAGEKAGWIPITF